MTASKAPSYPLEVTGAVLGEVRAPKPYALSRPLDVRSVRLDAPGPTEVLVKVEAAGVCHSDLSVVNGSRVRPTPMLLGHEAAGRVIDIGSEADASLLGRRVVLVFLPRCGECIGCRSNGKQPCVPGSAANGAGTLLSGRRALTSNGHQIHHHLGVSAFATHALVDARSVVPVDDDVPPIVAAVLGCAMLTGGGAVLNVNRPDTDTRVAVVGLGGVGMAALITAGALGVRNIVGIDQLPDKLALATTLGATETTTPAQALERGTQADLVIEAAGHPRAFETALQITAAGGTMVTVGLPDPAARSTIDPLSITAQAKTLTGAYLGASVPERDIPIFVELWRAGALDVESLVSETIELGAVNSAMDKLDSGAAVRQVIVFD